MNANVTMLNDTKGTANVSTKRYYSDYCVSCKWWDNDNNTCGRDKCERDERGDALDCIQ